MARKSKYEHLYIRSVTCNKCGRILISETSIKRGFGRECWEKLTNQGEYKEGKPQSFISRFLGGK